MRLTAMASAILVLTGWAATSAAQVVTPPDCHWAPPTRSSPPHGPNSVELWCKGPDGDKHPTGRMLEQGQDTSVACPGRTVYDGSHCVSEGAALAVADGHPRPRPAPAAGTKTQPAKPKPSFLLMQGPDGKARAEMVCAEGKDSTYCQDLR